MTPDWVKAGRPNRSFLSPAQRVYQPKNQELYWTILNKLKRERSPVGFLNGLPTDPNAIGCMNLPGLPVDGSIPRHLKARNGI